MRKIREILRLKWELGMGNRKVARSCSISHSTVRDLVKRAKKAGLSWPLPEELDDAALESMLYVQPQQPSDSRPQPDMEWIHRELRKKGVTLQLLWYEYKEKHPDGYQYSQFCDLYRRWKEALDVTMRQTHRAGEKAFIDFAGQTVPVVDARTGEIHQAQIFVAVLGASSYTYAEATWSQELSPWINANCNALEFFGGVPEILVPDNLGSGVTKACRYEPDVNPTYHEMARHYGTVVIPTRSRKPRDKSKAENGVQQVTRWILAALRNRTFFSLAELNREIAKKLEELNHKPFQKIEGSRHSFFVSLDKPALKPLPAERYEFAIWKKLRVGTDYHVEVEGDYYSTPYQLVKKQVDVRVTHHTVEILYNNSRVASHRRLYGKGEASTHPEHRHPSHKKYLEWTPERITAWADSIGPSTSQMVKSIMERQSVQEQGARSCLGILRLSNQYPRERLEDACSRGLKLRAHSYKSVASILEKGLDRLPLEERPQTPPPCHENIRGSSYYGNKGELEC